MGASDTGTARELVPAWPAPALRGIVVEYRGFRDDAPARSVQREPPSARVPIIIDFGAGWHVAAPTTAYRPARVGGFVAGMHDAFALVEAAGPMACMQVDLSPIGARRLLGVPMHELTNRVVPLDDLLGRDARELTQRLGEARSWQERFALLDATLARRLERSTEVSPGVEWAWRRLAARAGAMPIATLGGELGWSRKRLAAGFRKDIGLTPKTAARVLRFEALVTRLRAGKDPASWAELAADLGYFDQAHLVREVRRLAGVTPTELLAGGVAGEAA